MSLYGCTGHRPQKLGGFSPAIWRMLCDFSLGMVFKRSRSNSKWITGMALGFDQAIAHACIHLGVPFVAAVPYDGQERMWPVEAQTRYYDLLVYAQDIEIVSPGSYSPDKLTIRNNWVVDQVSGGLGEMVALWDRQPEGGTAQCVGYAKRQGVPVENVWDQWVEYRAGLQGLKVGG